MMIKKGEIYPAAEDSAASSPLYFWRTGLRFKGFGNNKYPNGIEESSGVMSATARSPVVASWLRGSF
jgi:hypothetical protein